MGHEVLVANSIVPTYLTHQPATEALRASNIHANTSPITPLFLAYWAQQTHADYSPATDHSNGKF